LFSAPGLQEKGTVCAARNLSIVDATQMSRLWAPLGALGMEGTERAIFRLGQSLLDENVLRQSRGFTLLWERDCPPENLSQSTRNPGFRWVNKTMRHELSLAAEIFASRIVSSHSLFLASQMPIPRTGA
jgi:hypothetical protein